MEKYQRGFAEKMKIDESFARALEIKTDPGKVPEKGKPHISM